MTLQTKHTPKLVLCKLYFLTFGRNINMRVTEVVICVFQAEKIWSEVGESETNKNLKKNTTQKAIEFLVMAWNIMHVILLG